MTLMVVKTTAELACDSRTDTRSASCSASIVDEGTNDKSESRM
jgi:hypothetical protein